MSKMGQWVFEMQEAASEMTCDQFIKSYGFAQLHIWNEVNGEVDYGEPNLGTGSKNRSVQHVNSGYGDEIPF